MAVWDPFAVLWLPHDAQLSGWDVVRGYERRMKIMRLTIEDRERWPGEVARFRRAVWALRTRRQRRQVLGDLLVQPDMPRWLREDPERKALVDALLSPLTGDLDDAYDRRALECEAALMRLECRAAGRRPWPPPPEPARSRPPSRS